MTSPSSVAGHGTGVAVRSIGTCAGRGDQGRPAARGRPSPRCPALGPRRQWCRRPGPRRRTSRKGNSGRGRCGPPWPVRASPWVWAAKLRPPGESCWAHRLVRPFAGQRSAGVMRRDFDGHFRGARRPWEHHLAVPTGQRRARRPVRNVCIAWFNSRTEREIGCPLGARCCPVTRAR